jgi:hypothetical protein
MAQRLLVLLVVLFVPAAASADVAPDRYVEPCTLEAMSAQHAGCEACRASLREPSACSDAHASDARHQACRSGGVSVWTEVWCLADEAAPSVPPSTTPAPASPAPAATSQLDEGHSSCSAARARSSAVAWALAALLVLTGARRSRRVRG